MKNYEALRALITMECLVENNPFIVPVLEWFPKLDTAWSKAEAHAAATISRMMDGVCRAHGAVTYEARGSYVFTVRIGFDADRYVWFAIPSDNIVDDFRIITHGVSVSREEIKTYLLEEYNEEL